MASKKQATAPMLDLDHDYQAEDDHRTLTRAAEIAGDGKRMSGVKRHHTKLSRGLAKVGSMIKH